MATENSTWQPGWGVAPGEVLREVLDDCGMSQAELSRRMDRPIKTINEIVQGKAAITAETAIQLERATGIAAAFWTSLESGYQNHLARERADADLAANVSWLREFPLKKMVDHGLVQPSETKSAAVEQLLAFFRVSSRSAWDKVWLAPTASFRDSPAFKAKPEAVAAWLRWGELQGETGAITRFDSRAFRETMPGLRRLSRLQSIQQAMARLQGESADCGVTVVLTPELPGAPVSGAARWLPFERPLIQLSLRHKSDDQLWFSFFHEGGHILTSSRRAQFVDGPDPEEGEEAPERVANQYARDMLIPPEPLQAFILEGDLGAESIRRFARLIEISPGIVVGRLQRDGLVSRRMLNYLKRTLQWGT